MSVSRRVTGGGRGAGVGGALRTTSSSVPPRHELQSGVEAPRDQANEAEKLSTHTHR